MGKFVVYITASLILILGFSACKKYPEDGKLSLHSVRYRLTKHKWILDKYTVNDKDSSSHTYSYIQKITNRTIYLKMENARLSFQTTKPNGYNSSLIGSFNITNDYSNDSMYISGGVGSGFDWTIHDKKIIIKIKDFYKIHNSSSPLLNQINENNEWDIRKLTDKEFIIETHSYNGKKLNLKFINF